MWFNSTNDDKLHWIYYNSSNGGNNGHSDSGRSTSAEYSQPWFYRIIITATIKTLELLTQFWWMVSHLANLCLNVIEVH